jgi:predicted O-linked N-acetylglucosamine transferase (SPINDLY family)
MERSPAATRVRQAIELHKQGRLDEAASLYGEALAMDPEHFDARHMLGVARLQQGRPDEAIALIVGALQRQPDSADALCDAGFAFQLVGRFDQAFEHYGRAIALRPRDADALNRRGQIALRLRRFDDAIDDFERALAIRPDVDGALNNLGNALAQQKRFDEAIACYDGVLAQHPGAPDALTNRGNALLALGRHREAIAAYDQAIAAKPGDAAAHFNRGIAWLALNLREEAVADLSRAIALRPHHAEALRARGHALMGLRRYEQAAASYREALSHDPRLPYVSGDLAHAQAHLCDWTDHDGNVRRLLAGVRADLPVCVPFTLVALCDDPPAQLQCAATYARKIQSAADPLPLVPVRRQRGKLRVAYLSANFHEHAVAYLIAELFELHDRSRFEIVGVSFGPESTGPMRARLVAGFDRFVDVRALGDREAAEVIRGLAPDIAVDLMGYTEDARPGILARRPAPIQVNFLGYPATMGADFIDYIIADRFIVPDDREGGYSERVVRLPDCYQVNDTKRRIADRAPAREALGLPENGFVFCCFNNAFKITPAVFDVWMRLLRRVDGSVLWLLAGNEPMQRNLQREAQARGVDPRRLVFAPKAPLDRHLARHRAADLFVDTLPYNAHTTASDALWAGLPVLTCAGNAFASRVAGSLLHAIGLPELVTGSLDEYEARAAELATHAESLKAIRERLAWNRSTAPLFLAHRFRRHIEAAYSTMQELRTQGRPPRSFDVQSSSEGGDGL